MAACTASPVGSSGWGRPWYIDLLNLNLNTHDLATARERIGSYVRTFDADGTRITGNLDFELNGGTQI